MPDPATTTAFYSYRYGARDYLVTTRVVDGRRTASTLRPVHDYANHPHVQIVTDEQLPDMPNVITICVVITAFCLSVIMVVLLGPLGLIPAVFLDTIGFGWAMEKIHRKRIERWILNDGPGYHPPLMSDDELNVRLTQLADPDEDRSYEEQPPIPLPPLLRHRAWLEWEEFYARNKVTIRSYGGMRFSIAAEQSEFFEKCLTSLKDFDERRQALMPGRHRNQHIAETGLRKLREACDEIDEAKTDILKMMRGIEFVTGSPNDYRPALNRPFTFSTDCRHGHVGPHYAGVIATGRDGIRRIGRTCRWCESIWSELV